MSIFEGRTLLHTIRGYPPSIEGLRLSKIIHGDRGVGLISIFEGRNWLHTLRGYLPSIDGLPLSRVVHEDRGFSSLIHR